MAFPSYSADGRLGGAELSFDGVQCVRRRRGFHRKGAVAPHGAGMSSPWTGESTPSSRNALEWEQMGS